MRWLTLMLVVGGLVLTLSATSFGMPITMNIKNFDEGTLYNVGDGTYTGEGTLDGLSQTPSTGGFINGKQSDTWGIFRVENMQDTPGHYLYQAGPSGEIVGIFWGLHDNYLKQVTDTVPNPDVVTQEIHGEDLQLALFMHTKPTWAASNGPGPVGWSVVAGAPTYAGITDGTVVSGDTATLIWTMKSTGGYSQLFPLSDLFENFNSAGATYNSTGNTLFDMGPVDGWGTGPDNGLLDTQTIPAWNAAGTAMDKLVDFSVTFSGTSADAGLWLLRTSDPFEGDYVPEPATMVLVALGGLGVLCRRKHR